MSVYNYGPNFGANYGGMVFGTIVLVSFAVGVARVLLGGRGPVRVELVHTERRGSWTGRVLRVGRWSEETEAWIGRSRFDVEVVGRDGSVHRSHRPDAELDDAIVFMRRELDAHAERKV